ncbi:hypothetical protein TNCV_1528781 [Trichonephila clavipes]|nr:hypothetical protein TNCV_1528781 [Trichonephila clavipes]
MFSETYVYLHDEIRRNSNNLRSLNRGGSSAFEKRIFLLRSRSLCAAEQFRSDASLEAVDDGRQFAARWSTAAGVPMLASSIRRCLLYRGLRSRVPLYMIPHTANH